MSLPKKASASAIARARLASSWALTTVMEPAASDDLREALRLDGRMDDELHAQGSSVESAGEASAGRPGRAGRVDVECRAARGADAAQPRPPRAMPRGRG